MGMIAQSSRIRMTSPGPDGDPIYNNPWGMDPVDPRTPYFVEVDGPLHWTALAGGVGGSDVTLMSMPHPRMQMNYLSAGLGIYTVDFSQVDPATLAFRISGDPACQWYRVRWGRPGFPYNTIQQRGDLLLP